jgi:hypothetical protein
LSNACGGQAVSAEATPHEIRDDGLRAPLGQALVVDGDRTVGIGDCLRSRAANSA